MKINRQVLFTVITLLIITLGAAGAALIAKGYRLLPNQGSGEQMIAGTGILSIASVPDQASVYLDGHLTTATNTNINSLQPRTYDVRITKEGFIPWQKKVEVKEGLVTQVKATLFRAIPSIYPLTYSGAQNALLSPDGQKVAFIVPEVKEGNVIERRKGGIWVWEMSEQPIAFARGGEPHQVALSTGIDLTQAKLEWSPDSSQILVSLPNQHLLLDASRLNDPPRDVTAVLNSTAGTWKAEKEANDQSKIALIKDLELRKIASESAVLKFSPDETKFMHSRDGKTDFKVVDLEKGKSYNLQQADFYSWLPNSEHILLVESSPQPTTTASTKSFPSSKLAIIEFDGNNKADIYYGNFEPQSVFVWPDNSRLVIVSSLSTPTASQPNLFGINLK